MEEKIQDKTLLNEKHRFWELDFVRGLCVLLMILDHAAYSIMRVAPMIDEMLGKTIWDGASSWVANSYWYGDFRTLVRFFVLGAFFLICGISCTFSRSNAKRGTICFFVGCFLTFVTTLIDQIFDMGISIYFGVLHMLGVSMLIYAGLQAIGRKIQKLGKTEKNKAITSAIGDYLPSVVGIILLIVYFACWYDGIRGDMPITDSAIDDVALSKLVSLFVNLNVSSEFVIGGSDYWTLLPWSAIVLAGGAIGVGLYKSKAKNYLAFADGKWNKPICFLGRHALAAYVLHQVAVVVVLFLVTLIA